MWMKLNAVLHPLDLVVAAPPVLEVDVGDLIDGDVAVSRICRVLALVRQYPLDPVAQVGDSGLVHEVFDHDVTVGVESLEHLAGIDLRIGEHAGPLSTDDGCIPRPLPGRAGEVVRP
jgi:hypothetical protein